MFSVSDSQSVQDSLTIDQSEWQSVYLARVDGTELVHTGRRRTENDHYDSCESWLDLSGDSGLESSPYGPSSGDWTLFRTNEFQDKLGHDIALDLRDFTNSDFELFGGDCTGQSQHDWPPLDTTEPALPTTPGVSHKDGESVRTERSLIKDLASETDMYNFANDQPIECIVPGCVRRRCFSRPSDLRRHHIEQHTKIRFACDFCGRRFKRRYERVKHQRERHENCSY